jgi:hypothetical protein
VKTVSGVLGIALLLTGVVWILQGARTLQGSFMTGSVFWLWMGILAVVAGVPLAVLGFRGSRRGPRS